MSAGGGERMDKKEARLSPSSCWGCFLACLSLGIQKGRVSAAMLCLSAAAHEPPGFPWFLSKIATLTWGLFAICRPVCRRLLPLSVESKALALVIGVFSGLE